MVEDKVEMRVGVMINFIFFFSCGKGKPYFGLIEGKQMTSFIYVIDA